MIGDLLKKKGSDFENEVFNQFNPYSKNQLDYYAFKHGRVNKIKVNDESFKILRNYYIGGHETDLAIIDTDFIPYLKFNISGHSIGKRKKGYLMLIECKNYENNLPKSLSSELLAKNYILKPNASIIVKKDNGNKFNWVKNFKLSGVKLYNFDNCFKNYVFKTLKGKKDLVNKTLKKSFKFFKKNEKKLEKKLLKKVEHNNSPSFKKREGSMRIINYTDKKIIRLSQVRKLVGDAIFAETPMIVYHSKNSCLTESAEKFLKEYDLLSKEDGSINRIRFYKTKYDSLESIINSNKFNKLPRALNVEFVNKGFYNKSPSVIKLV